MKGIVFCEFLELVEHKFSMDMVDDIIFDAKPPNGGSYTAVGTYEHTEMVDLVSALSTRTGISLKGLLSLFGEHLFGRFATLYPHFFIGMTDSFQFLSGIDRIIHAEVLKLYPDAQLPKFEIESNTDLKLIILYQSGRHFEDLAEGLMNGCFNYFKQCIKIQRQNLIVNGVQSERFELTRG